MKKTILILTAAIAVALSSCTNSGSKSEQKNPTDTTKNATATMYQCPMHPEETSDKPTTCSKCGMDLVEVERK